MWKRDESVAPAPPAPAPGGPTPAAPAPPAALEGTMPAAPAMGIGGSIVLKGELTAQEDVVVDGLVEGRIDLPGHTVTVGQKGRVQATIVARRVVIFGRVTGDVEALEGLVLSGTARLEGTAKAPRLTVMDGAYLKGTVEMPAARPPAPPA
ncbi:MAG: polymer-forming cytoskeletal protein [Vicinamibacterales bacterium]